ncbi:MAG: fibronectin type III domain-containing protein [Kiritimatiellae bacterium]|nr:fibronectin type III domain-containing protein [Kiritimatiellia bacterium]
MHSADNNKSIIAYHDSVIPSLDGSNWNSVFVDTSSSRNNICFVLTPNIFSEPVDLVVRNCTEQTATLTWMAPDTDNAITGYTYQFKRVSDTAWSAEVATNGTSLMD